MSNNIGTHNINRNINIYEYFTIKKNDKLLNCKQKYEYF